MQQLAEDRSDPWSAERVAQRVAGFGRAAHWVGTWALGLGGPLVRHVGDRFAARAVLLACCGVLWLALVWWVGRFVPSAGADDGNGRGRRWLGTAALTVAAAAVVLLAPAGGHRGALVAMVGLFVAQCALLGGTVPARSLRSAAPAAMLAAAPLTLAGVLWFRQGPIAGVLGLQLLGLGLVAVGRHWPGLGERSERFLTGAVAGLGNGVAAAVVALVATPVLYLPGLLGRLVDCARRQEVTSTWVPSEPTSHERRRSAERPFVPTAAPLRRVRHLRGAVVVLFIVLLVVVYVDA